MTLCNGLVAVTHRLCVDDVDSAELMAFMHVNLFICTKNPGVQHIGVGDVSQRIIAFESYHPCDWQ